MKFVIVSAMLWIVYDHFCIGRKSVLKGYLHGAVIGFSIAYLIYVW